MEKNTIFKTLGFVGFVFGAGTMAIAIYNRYKRKEDEVTTVDALVKADILTQSFSGANGKTSKAVVHLCTDGKRTWFSSKPCGVIGADNSTGRMAGDYCKVGRGKGLVYGSDGILQPDGHGGLDCVPKGSSAARMNINNNPIPKGAGFASVDSRLK